MKKPLHFILILFILLTFIFVISSCNHDLKKDNDDDNQTIENNDDDNNQTTENNNDDNPTVDSIGVNADSFFWGTWVRMDNGKEYEFLESSVEQAAKKYKVEASNDNSISVSELGTFTKESDSVIVCDNIPYFRKGGTNLEYLLKIVGFESSIRQAGRAAGSVVGGIRGKGKSKKYTTFESDGESDIDGFIKLTAPTVNDVQTVTISNGNDVVVIPGLAISNSGDYMGTVALVGKDDYNLKITGTIGEALKDDGYLYGNNAKSYDMVLTITNISENKCKSSVCTISTEDPNLNLSSETNLQGFTISTLANGATKTINLSISYGNLTEPYVNTGINIKITNASTGQEWIDYIPLRFFKGTIPITISAKNPENNKNAALNGFVIYPDGNNQFFAIPHNSSKPVFVPTFGKDNSYKLVFSGATVTSKLDDSTEMYYTVEPASLNPRKVVTEGDAQELIEYMNFGGDNHSETTAYSVTQGFESYLSEGEIDYYTISADSDYYYSANQIPLFSVGYENEKGAAPETILVKAGSSLTSDQLPELKYEGFEFLGWYDGEKKIVEGDKISGNVVLKARWKQVSFLVRFETNGGSEIESYSTSVIGSVPETMRENYVFDGWYMDTDFRGNAIGFPYAVTGDVVLYAKWIKKCVVRYKTDFDKTPLPIIVNEGEGLSVEQLPVLIDNDYYFIGWYDNETLVSSETYVVGDDLTLVAKWNKKLCVSYISEHGTTPNAFFVRSGTLLIDDNLPELKEKGWRFKGWYTDNQYDEDKKCKIGQIVTEDLILYAKWIEFEDRFVFIQGGTVVGSDDYDSMNGTGRFCPGTTTTIDNFYMCDHELTQGEYEEFCCYTTFAPYITKGIGIDYPVYYVSWYDAIVYCNLRSIAEELTPCYALSDNTDPRTWNGIKNIDGKYSCDYQASDPDWNSITCNWNANGYRLPTEAEWEFAARGGMKSYGTDEFAYFFAGTQSENWTTDRNSDLDNVGWYWYNICNDGITGDSASDSKYGYGVHEVKEKKANALGLYDMSGNVFEWCWDWYDETVNNLYGALSGSYRVFRGGSWTEPAWGCLIAYRFYHYPELRNDNLGFRLVRSTQ